jgi:hypothetical protein
MRTIFVGTGLLMFLVALLCVATSGNDRGHQTGWGLTAVGFALSGGLCYLSAALTKSPAAAGKAKGRAAEREELHV